MKGSMYDIYCFRCKQYYDTKYSHDGLAKYMKLEGTCNKCASELHAEAGLLEQMVDKDDREKK